LDTLEYEALYWPKASQQKFISERIEEKYGFPNCVGFVDGTILPLEFKPNLYGEEYYCHKGCYGVNCLVIRDEELRILVYLIGWPASVHDNHVWKSTELMKAPSKFFSVLQYVLADSAFGSTHHCIPSYKKCIEVQDCQRTRNNSTNWCQKQECKQSTALVC
jgi:hypothetical protein